MSAEADRMQAANAARAIRIPAGSVNLEGELQVPPDPQGLVIFAHGSGNHHHPANQLFGEHLRRSGLGTVLLDLFTPDEEADGSTCGRLSYNMGLLTQRLVCAAYWLVEEDEARQLRLGFFGSSTAGGAALVAAADLGRLIGAVVSHEGRPDLAGNALRRVKTPTLLIAGEHEETLAVNQEAFSMLDCPKALSVVTGAPQVGEAGALGFAARLAADWFLKYLRHSGGSRFAR